MQRILGIRYGHDAGAAVVIDGKIVADAAEERFTRIKNDGSFPINAIRFCLQKSGLLSEDLDAVVFPSLGYVPEPFFAFFCAPDTKPKAWKVKISMGHLCQPGRLLRTPHPSVPQLPLYMRPMKLSPSCVILTVDHHLAHAASAYFTSGLYDEPTLVVTIDGRGDGISAAVWGAHRNKIDLRRRWDGSASLGWFYACATEELGWRHGSDEWQTMGLAAYGKPKPSALSGFGPEFEDGELKVRHDFGEVSRWNDHGANHYHLPDAVALSEKVRLLGPENFAAEVQRFSEEQALNLIMPLLKKERICHLCCAGGFFLNVKLNQKIWLSGELKTQWVYPNPGDSGLAAGAALLAYYLVHPDQPSHRLDHMYFGPEYGDKEIECLLQERKLVYEKHDTIAQITARHLVENKIVGWFQGCMESGPRALGNRSILMSPLRAENKDIINSCVKYREAFRPFCPSLLFEHTNDYLISGREEPFMITSFPVPPEKQNRIPAVVHIDGTARPQTVRREVNPLFYDLIKAFGESTGEYAILNTSFNVKGEPIVCHPRDAIRCFFDTGIDLLVLGNFVLDKSSK